MKTLFLVLAAILALPCISASAPLALESQQVRELESGAIVPLKAPPASATNSLGVAAAILIDAPPHEVWKVVIDKESAPDYMDGLLRAKVVERGKGYFLVEQEVKVTPLPGTFTYVLKLQPHGQRRLDFTRVSGDFRDIRGSWILQPVDGRKKTILIHSLYVDAGPLIPQALLNRSSRKSMPELLGILRSVIQASPRS